MSDLSRALREELEAFRPDRQPPFSALRARRDRRRRQRLVGATALSAVAGVVTITALVPALVAVQEERSASVAGPTAGAAEASRGTPPSPQVEFPGLPGDPDDVTLVEICSDSDGQECRSLARDVDPAADRALELARAFATAVPTAVQSTVCRTGTGEELTVRFRSAQEEGAAVRVRVGCADVWIGVTRYSADADVEQLVRQAYGNPPWAAVEDLVSQCVGSDRPQPLREFLGLADLEVLALARVRGLEVVQLGSGAACRAGSQRPYAPGRLVVVFGADGRAVWAGLA